MFEIQQPNRLQRSRKPLVIAIEWTRGQWNARAAQDAIERGLRRSGRPNELVSLSLDYFGLQALEANQVVDLLSVHDHPERVPRPEALGH